MGLQSLGGNSPTWLPGITGELGDPWRTTSALNSTVNATSMGMMWIGQVATADGLSHTIDTTLSSSIGLRTAGVTWANASTTAKVGLCTVDTGNGPPARATNSAGILTFSVYRAVVGGDAAFSANAWKEFVPNNGSLVIANGDYVAFGFQITNRAGADSVAITSQQMNTTPAMPCTTTVSAAGAFASATGCPNVVLTFSDGTLGFFVGCVAWNTPSTNVTQSNASTPLQFGNYFNFPFPVQINGLTYTTNGGSGGNFDVELWTLPLSSAPSLVATTSTNLKVRAGTGGGLEHRMFTTPYNAHAGEDLACIFKPTDVNTGNWSYQSVASLGHWAATALDSSHCYALTRNSGVTTAFTQQNSGKDRYNIAPIIGKAFTGTSDLINLGGLIG